VAKEVRALIQAMWQANPTWGSPRIVGELRKLGIDVAKSTVETYRVRPRKPPSPTWKTFLHNHVKDLVAMDFFVVPTVTYKVLFVLVILAHARRRVVHVNITEHPTAAWTAQQVIDAFPWDEPPRYLLRDRDRIYGASFRQRVQHMGIEEVVIAPRSPWQNPYVERLIGSIRRECLDHVIVLHERHLRRLLTDYFRYYHDWRTHRALDMDCPVPRPVQRPEIGPIREVPEVGGLHHHYERQAAWWHGGSSARFSWRWVFGTHRKESLKETVNTLPRRQVFLYHMKENIKQQRILERVKEIFRRLGYAVTLLPMEQMV
jgi:putative transposase